MIKFKKRKTIDKKKKMTTYWMGENICKWPDWWGITIQHIEIAHTTQHKKNKQEFCGGSVA